MDATGHLTLEVVPPLTPGPNRCRGGSGRTGWDAVAPIIDDDSLAPAGLFHDAAGAIKARCAD